MTKTTQHSWDILAQENPDIISQIERDIKKNGMAQVVLSDLPSKHEARLLNKQDHNAERPLVFKERGWYIYPTGNTSVGITTHKTYVSLPQVPTRAPNLVDMTAYNKRAQNMVALAPYEFGKGFSNEGDGVKFLVDEGHLSTFLETGPLESMSTGRRRVSYSSVLPGATSVVPNECDALQAEMDGVFENEDTVLILEMKNQMHGDVALRQVVPAYHFLLQIMQRKQIRKNLRYVVAMASYDGFALYEVAVPDIDIYDAKLLQTQHIYCLSPQDQTARPIKLIQAKNLEFSDIPQSNDVRAVLETAILSESATVQELAVHFNVQPREIGYRLAAAASLDLTQKQPWGWELTKNGKKFRAVLHPQTRQDLFVDYLKSIPLLDHAVFTTDGKAALEHSIHALAPKACAKLSRTTLNRRLQCIKAWAEQVRSALPQPAQGQFLFD